MIVNNGAVMRVRIKNNQMIQGQWLKPGEIVMIPNNKAVSEYEEEGFAEVVKWRKRKIPEPPTKIGPKENTALNPVLETAIRSISQDEKPVIGGVPKGQKKTIVEKRR